MSLFDGVQNFTPAFTGQQIAIEAGKGAGQGISRGMSGATSGKSQGLQQQKFDTETRQYDSMIKRLDEFSARRRGALMGSDTGGSGFEGLDFPG